METSKLNAYMKSEICSSEQGNTSALTDSLETHPTQMYKQDEEIKRKKKMERNHVIKTLLRLERKNKTNVPKLIEPKLNIPQPNLDQFNGFAVNPNKGQSNKLTNKHPELAKDECDICGYRSSREGVVRHKQRRHPKNVYHCDVCKAKFGVKYDMRRHRMNHFDSDGKLTPKGRRLFLENNPNDNVDSVTLAAFEENFQSKEVVNTETLQQPDQKVAATSEIIQDREEPRSTLVQTSVKSQDSQEAKSKPKYPPKDTSKSTCEICKKVFPTRCLAVHMRIHAKKELLKCTHSTKCSFETYERGKMNEHIRLKHLRLWHCDECMGAFHTRSALETHIEGVHGENVQCQICLKTVSTHRYLAVHMQREHPDAQRYFCPTCKKGFYDKESMVKHSAKHMAQDADFPGKIFTCSYCPKKFTRKSILKQHENTHTGHKPYKCDQCPKSFSYGAHLHKHKKVHSDERKHQCKFCLRCFKFPYKLAQHMIMHTGDPKHKCPDCGKCFTSYSTLKTHSCKAFSTGNILHRHYQPPIITSSVQQNVEVSVTQNDPESQQQKNTLFMCGFCEALFNSFDEVNAHVLTHQNEALPMESGDLSELGLLGEIQEETSGSETLETLVINDGVEGSEEMEQIESANQILDQIDGEQMDITQQVCVDGEIKEETIDSGGGHDGALQTVVQIMDGENSIAIQGIEPSIEDSQVLVSNLTDDQSEGNQTVMPNIESTIDDKQLVLENTDLEMSASSVQVQIFPAQPTQGEDHGRDRMGQHIIVQTIDHVREIDNMIHCDNIQYFDVSGQIVELNS